MMRVVFLQIKDSQTKLLKLVNTVHHYFQAKEKFLIMVQDLASAKYVDELLWKVPQVSFLPHCISDHQTDEPVVISMKKENLNRAKYIFNLCPTPLLWENIHILYEYEDFTHPAKQMLSKKKYESYKEQKYFIESTLP